ncbi:CRISPR-associated endonuclease Cas2 [bacterium]|nr:CRISPR-associated endonuclease Cas2 [bacterium]
MISGYRAMWLLVMFDLPVKKKVERRAATQFRKQLLKDGFNMVQFSIYSRPCPSEENAEVHCIRVRGLLPNKGQVRILKFTDKQYARMECFQGPIPAEFEKMPSQTELF